MKRLCLTAAIIMMMGSAGIAQPPEGDRNSQDRPQIRDGQRRDGQRREGQDDQRRGDERGPRDGQPPEGRRPGGPPGFGGGRPGGQPGFGGQQGFGGGFGGRGQGFAAMFPVMKALDSNQDGEISAEEIANATASLKKLDKNEDGKIDAAEMRPEFPGGGFGGDQFRGRPGAENGGNRPGRPPMDEPAGERGDRNPAVEAFVARIMNMDANKDGTVAKDEMPERMQSMLTRLDKNGDSALDREEIMAAARERTGGNRPQGDRPPGDRPAGDRPPGQGPPEARFSAEQLLQRVDGDKDGFISAEEAPEFLKGRFDQIDANADGKLDREELNKMAQQMRERGGRPGGDRPERRERPAGDGAGNDAPRRDRGDTGNRRPPQDNP